MRVTLKLPEDERRRQDRSIGRAKKRARRVKMMRIHDPIHPALGAYATADAARVEKRLVSWQNQALLPSSGRPLGECRRRPLGSVSLQTLFPKWGASATHCFQMRTLLGLSAD
jgi:hypothetical protein